MATDRRKQVLLGVLLVVLAAVVYNAVWTSRALAPTSNPARTPAAARGKPEDAVTAPDVHLDALNGERPKPLGQERNLFRFKPVAPPPAGGGLAPVATAPVTPAAPPGPPPLPPIALKFLGTVQAEQKDGGKMTIAVLTDGLGPPLYGKEGDTIAGRYRILHIGVESIEMSYLDGRGRQTIRQTGS